MTRYVDRAGANIGDDGVCRTDKVCLLFWGTRDTDVTSVKMEIGTAKSFVKELEQRIGEYEEARKKTETKVGAMTTRTGVTVKGDRTTFEFYQDGKIMFATPMTVTMDTCLAAELAAFVQHQIQIDADARSCKKKKEEEAAFERLSKAKDEYFKEVYYPEVKAAVGPTVPIALIAHYDFGDTSPPVSQAQWRMLVDKFNLLLERLNRP